MDIMSILSYGTEIPFKKKMFLPHLEVVSSHFRDSWGMFSMCTPEILSYFFWAIFTYKLFFFTPGIPPQTRSSTLLYSTVYSIQCISSVPYTIWSLASFSVLPPGASSSYSGLLTKHSLGICSGRSLCSLILLLLSTHPDST